jgi:hypothetical protein
MKKFKVYEEQPKQPKQILAVQYLEHLCKLEGVCPNSTCYFKDGSKCHEDHIHTKNGIFFLKIGDWITPDGEFFRILTHEEICQYGLIPSENKV